MSNVGLNRSAVIALAWRDMRGGLSQSGLGAMRIVLLCLALGVAAIGTVGGLRAAIQGGVAAQRRALLGGDLSLQSADPLPGGLAAMLSARGARVSQTESLRTMLYAGNGKRMLVEARGLDPAYPLVGQVLVQPALALQAGIAQGVLVEPLIADRLGVAPGATLRLGGEPFRLVGLLAHVPDSAGSTELAPTVMVTRAALDRSGLIAPGALVTYTLRASLDEGRKKRSAEQLLKASRALAREIGLQFPDLALHIRDVNDAAPTVTRTVAQLAQFMTLIGLASLLLGGLGVASGVASWLEARRATLTVLRCLGASSRVLSAIVCLQLGSLCGAGILLGVVAGVVIPWFAIRALAGLLPIAPDAAVHAAPLLLSAAFGILVAILFALPPSLRAVRLSPSVLLRHEPGEVRRAGWTQTLALAVLLAAMVGLAMATSPSPLLALGFCGVAALVLLLFLGVAWMLRAACARLGRSGLGSVWWRLGLRALYRPGAPASSLLLALGAGLTTLASIALIESNIRAAALDQLPKHAPSFYFIDLQPGDTARFKSILSALPDVGEVRTLPSLRTRIVAVDGIPAASVKATAQTRWLLRGDHGLSLSGPEPPGTHIDSGRWWPADYAGPPQISIDAVLAQGWKTHLGSMLTLNVLGRDIDLRVSSLRDIEWQSLQLNFAFIASPGLLSQAPHTMVATVASKGTPAGDAAILQAVTDALPNVTGIRVADVLGEIAALVQKLALALQSMGLLALLSGALVLAATLASGQIQRRREAAILRSLGATSRQLRAAWLVEFATLGAVAGLASIAIGALLSWLVLTYVLEAPWSLRPLTLAATVVGATALMLVAGLFATRQAMRASPAELLRDS